MKMVFLGGKERKQLVNIGVGVQASPAVPVDPRQNMTMIRNLGKMSRDCIRLCVFDAAYTYEDPGHRGFVTSYSNHKFRSPIWLNLQRGLLLTFKQDCDPKREMRDSHQF